MNSKYEVVIVGGAGHIGVPLALALTQANIKTLISKAVGTLLLERTAFLLLRRGCDEPTSITE